MSVAIHFEEAARQMEALANSDLVDRLRGANEATNRLLLINKVLALLGWDETEYNPEQVTSTKAYTDYRLSIDGQARLIVEAKRQGVVEPLPKTIKSTKYTNQFLAKNCGDGMHSLMHQCKDYCADCGVAFALATTGDMWVVLIGFKLGVAWGQMDAFVFHSLDDITARFSEFYGLLSREGVKNNSLEEKFAGVLITRPNVAILPSAIIDGAPFSDQVMERSRIEMFFDRFMGDITNQGQETMLEQCYVTSRELDEYSQEMRQYWDYDAALDRQGQQDGAEQKVTYDEVNEQRLENELDLQFDAEKPRTILLVGNVGAGKTTFVHRFISAQAHPKKNVCVIVDLINKAPLSVVQDRAEWDHLAKLVLEELARKFTDFDPYDPDVLRNCFESPLARFRKQMEPVRRENSAIYEAEEAKHLRELSTDKFDHLVGYIKYARKRHNRVWVAFDNVDRGSESYQAFVYTFAHGLADQARCVTIITMREDTYREAAAGFLDVRSDKVFFIKAPELGRVISKRCKYIEHLITHEELPSSFRVRKQLITLLNWHIKKLVLDDRKNFVRLLVSSFSLKNVRESLSLLKSYYSSYHSTFHEFYNKHKEDNLVYNNIVINYEIEYRRFLQSIMLGNSWSYQHNGSKVFNVFSVERYEKSSYFLILRLLAYLLENPGSSSIRKSIKYDLICQKFVPLGYPHHHVDNATRKLLYEGLLQSPNLPASPLKEAKIEVPDPIPANWKVALSLKGYYYLRYLVSQEYYQTRVGEDTIWYDTEMANAYIECLRDSVEAQSTYEADDALHATAAREVFLKYLRKSLHEEIQTFNIQHISEEWIKVMNIVERSVFGEVLTQRSSITSTSPTLEGSDDTQVTSSSSLRVAQQQLSSQSPTQLSFVSSDGANYGYALQEAINSLGPLPLRKWKNSSYMVKVLWALEIASRAGLGSQNASDIARIVNAYGTERIEATNVARFFRNQIAKPTYTHFWKQSATGQYTISPTGSDILIGLINPEQQEED